MIKFDLKNHRREVVGAIIVLFLLRGCVKSKHQVFFDILY